MPCGHFSEAYLSVKGLSLSPHMHYLQTHLQRQYDLRHMSLRHVFREEASM